MFKDKDGNVIPGTTTETGEQPKKDIPGYRLVDTKKLPNGDTEYIYEKVNTVFKDKDGNVIPGTTTEVGEQPKKDVPGYRFVETKKLPNGDIEHVYEKVTTPVVEKTTTWTDENGNPLKPSEKGSVEAGSVPGYEFVRTVVDGNGNVRHIFKKATRIPATNIVTTWTDENGNPLRPSENGAKGMGMVEGYEFVRTVVDENGNIRHIFRKVTAATPKAQVKRLANTGSETSNTAAAGFGVLLAGIAAAIRKRKKED